MSWQLEVSQGQKVTYIISGWLSMFSQNLSEGDFTESSKVVKNLPSTAEDMVRIPSGTKISHAAAQLSPCTTAG